MSTAKPGPRPSEPVVLLDPPYWDAYDPKFPDSDGKPMADSTTQYRWMVTIAENLEEFFEDRGDVLVACDLLWYFDPTNPRKSIAPDVFVAFGRPKARRHSYKEWLEGHAPEVVFEIHSPSNTPKRMREKREIHEARGVEEYYEYDPESGRFQGWLRDENGRLEPIAAVDGWTSPRLGVTFEAPAAEEALIIRRPNGEAFQHVQDIMRDRRKARRAVRIQRRRLREAEYRIEQADLRAQQFRIRGEADRQARAEADARAQADRQARAEADARAETERQRAEAQRQRAERLAAKLRELGMEDD